MMSRRTPPYGTVHLSDLQQPEIEGAPMAPRQTVRRLLVAVPALALALGVTACSPPNEQPADADAPYTLPTYSEEAEHTTAHEEPEAAEDSEATEGTEGAEGTDAEGAPAAGVPAETAVPGAAETGVAGDQAAGGQGAPGAAPAPAVPAN